MCTAVGLPCMIRVQSVIVAQSSEAKQPILFSCKSCSFSFLFKFLMVPMVVRALTCGLS